MNSHGLALMFIRHLGAARECGYNRRPLRPIRESSVEFENYSSFWNKQAATEEGAFAGVDGSASEDIVRMTGEWTANQVRQALQLDGSQSVVELGCGVGRIGRELMHDCAKWTGTDISGAMLKVAKERLQDFSHTEFVELERTSLDMLQDASLDRAYSVAVLCHMDKEDLYLYLQELHRILKDGGMAYIETWNLSHPMGWKRWEFEVANWARSDHSKRKDVARNQFCAPDELRLYLEHAGFDVISLYDDSAWNQATVAKGLSPEELASQQERMARLRPELEHSQLWSTLFGELLDVIYGVVPPQTMLEALEQREPSIEVDVYRKYLLALWRQGEAHWGPAPTKS